jgi:hypothetical protein
MNIRPMGVEFFRADGWTGTTKFIVAFRNFANAPKKASNSVGFCKFNTFIPYYYQLTHYILQIQYIYTLLLSVNSLYFNATA